MGMNNNHLYAAILQVGDEVYSAANGQPMKVTRIYSVGFETDVDYYSFDDHRVLFWLHKKSYLDNLKRK